MKKILSITILILSICQMNSNEFVAICELPHGFSWGSNPLIADFDKDSLDEILLWMFNGDSSFIYFYEYQFDDEFKLIKTNSYNNHYLISGIGDFDSDGLNEILGGFYTPLPIVDSCFIFTMEQSDSFTFPEVVTWRSDTMRTFRCLTSTKALSSDSTDKIAGLGIPTLSTAAGGKGWYYLDCVSDNSYSILHEFAENDDVKHAFALGDLNNNYLTEAVMFLSNEIGIIRYETIDSLCDSFYLVDTIFCSENIRNLVISNDTDNDGKGELLIQADDYYQPSTSENYYGFNIYEDDNGDGNLDSIWATEFGIYTDSWPVSAAGIDFGDIDGDGLSEVLICGGRHFEVWKSYANNQYMKIFEWTDPSMNTILSHILSHDFNNNGTDEIVFSGTGNDVGEEATYIFEYRAIAKLGYNDPSILENSNAGIEVLDTIFLHSLDDLPVIIDSMELSGFSDLTFTEPIYPCSIPARDSIPIELILNTSQNGYHENELIIYSNDWYGQEDTIELLSGTGVLFKADSVVASDNRNPVSGIDGDDFVRFYFNYPADTVGINKTDIDSIFILSDGHSWLDGAGEVTTLAWSSDNTVLTVLLSTNASVPTVMPGDTVYFDADFSDERYYSSNIDPAVITGSFGPAGIEDNNNAEHTGSLSINYEQSMLNIVSPVQSSLIIYDITGRQTMNKSIPEGNHTISISDIPSGIYFIKFNSINQKILLLK